MRHISALNYLLTFVVRKISLVFLARVHSSRPLINEITKQNSINGVHEINAFNYEFLLESIYITSLRS